MLHDKFNLFLATGTKQYLEFLLTCNVKNVLISFAYKEPWALKPLMKWNNVNLLCDSGAFTAWNLAENKKAEGDPNWKRYLINIDEYSDFIDKHKDIIFRAVNLDVIPGQQGQTPSQEEIVQAAEKGWENYLYLKRKGHDTVHVFHQGEPTEYLDRMINEGCDYIGISPSNDNSDEKKLIWLDHIFRHIANSKNPKIKTHGFGVTSRRLVERYPWFSCDSSSYSLTAAMGSILTPYGRVYISDQNKFDPDHIENKPEQIRDHITKYLMDEIGYPITTMTKTVEEQQETCPSCQNKVLFQVKTQAYKPRNFANIIYFLKLQAKVRKEGPNMDFIKQQVLF